MTKRILFCCCLIIVTSALGYAQQRKLNFEDRSGSFDVFSGGNNEAGMLIICPESIELTFSSNKDQTVEVFRTEVKGSEKYYYLRLPVGKRYESRKLTVYAPRYESLLLDAELQPKELRTIYIYDPDVILLGCYNQTMKEGLEIFRLAQYPDAKAKYRLAAECSDAPATVINDIQEKIDIIDTIIHRRRVADESFLTGDYRKAYSNYQAALALNIDDRYVELRMNESSSRLGIKPVRSASLSYDRVKEYKKEIRAERRKQNVFAISYENMLMKTYGLSFGWYRAGKCGIYFAGHYATSGNTDYGYYKGSRDEQNLSMGLTFRLFRFAPEKPSGAWWSFGVGYTSAWAGDGSDDDYDDPITPETGILFKFGWLVMKYTFQYRFFEDSYLLEKPNHLVGIGICF